MPGFEPSTLAAWPLALCQALRHRHIAPEPLLQQVGLCERSLLSRPDERVEIARMTQLWQLAEQATADAAFGLSVSRHVQPMHLHAVGMLAMACSSLQQVLEKVVQYHDMVSNSAHVTLVHRPDSLGVQLTPLANVPLSPLALDAFMATLVRFANVISGMSGNDLLTEVALHRARPAQPQPWQQTYQVPVTFAQPQCVLWFRRSALQQQLIGDSELLAAHERRVQQYLQQRQQAGYGAKVQRVIGAMLAQGEPSQVQIAQQLNISERSLRRLLAQENTSFRHCLQQVRHTLACQRLRASDEDLTSIALQLGFSDSSNFSRSFLRWQGERPSQYRARCRQSEAV
ncbi:AraC family transcriptional regulator [Bacterioplanes sanyensis]|uniref:AraC family transcriptional regulator n=1 Tax=Bacterioplanes sanyensis TaxID=1249553 RepID=A0A222FJL0_9GAMM|nr:AraC family transcriptional regulator [Bacterioplanes sanyensis]ASP39237.1 AraC family transcriptional regulator [Bacterioplanes sanyensis]